MNSFDRDIHLLLDGDWLVYKHGFAVEREANRFGFPTALWNFQYNVGCQLQRIQEKTGASRYTIYLSKSNDTTFRSNLEHVKYKDNRKDARRPLIYHQSRELLTEQYNTVIVSGMEADDALGIYQRPNTIIVTVDKDLRMIPGKHYNIKTGRVWDTSPMGYIRTRKIKGKTKIYSAGFAHFCMQMLTGDTVDNIPGVPGIGPVKAYQALKDCKTVPDFWMKLNMVYMRRDLSYNYMMDQATALWILRKKNQSFEVWLNENYR